MIFNGLKRCSRCGKTKLISLFHKDNGNIDGLHGWCIECKEGVKSLRKKTHPFMSRARRALSTHRRIGCVINITIEETEQLFRDAKFCPICGCELLRDLDGERKYNTPSLDRIDNELNLNIKIFNLNILN